MVQHVILSFDSSEPEVTLAFKQRIQIREAEKGVDVSLDEIKVIYLADLSQDQFMTWTGISPSEEEKKILQSLQGGDKVYLWGHGNPNSGYIPGGFYTEIADYLEKGLNKDNFSPSKGALNISVATCSAGKGGVRGKQSFAALFHAYLGKIGIFSKVSARMAILWTDAETLRDEGVKTVDRFHYGMAQAFGTRIDKKRIKHQEERSKVTYMWDPTGQQVRVDAYRSSLLDEFIRLKEKISANVAKSDGKLTQYPKLYQRLLKIEFSLSDHTRPLNAGALKSNVQALYEDYSQAIGLDEGEPIKDNFEHFKAAIKRKAHAHGFILEKTGLHRSTPKLAIEEKSFAEVISDLPPLKKLDEIVSMLSNKENAPQGVFEIVGSEASKDDNNFYAHFFTFIRRIIIWQHDGTANIPDSLVQPINIVNQMLETVLLDNTKTLKEKKAELKKLKNDLDAYYSPTVLNQGIAWITGLMLGLRGAYQERHETSLWETIPNFFYYAFVVAAFFLDTFISSCEQVEKVTNLCSDTLKALEKPSKIKYSQQSFFPSEDEKVAPKALVQDDELQHHP